MTTPATTAWDRWIAWPGFANDDFNAFVASEVAAVERERDAAETRLAAAEGLLRRWLVWIEPGASVRPCPDGETRAFLSPPSPATGYGVGDDADGTDALLQRWEVWWAKAPCAPKHPAKAPDSRLPAAYRHLRATPAEAKAAGIETPAQMVEEQAVKALEELKKKGVFLPPPKAVEATAAGVVPSERCKTCRGHSDDPCKCPSPSRAAEADPVGAGIAYAHGLMRTTEVPLGREDMARWYDLRDAYAEGVKAGRPPPPSAGITAEERAALTKLREWFTPNQVEALDAYLAARDGREGK